MRVFLFKYSHKPTKTFLQYMYILTSIAQLIRILKCKRQKTLRHNTSQNHPSVYPPPYPTISFPQQIYLYFTRILKVFPHYRYVSIQKNKNTVYYVRLSHVDTTQVIPVEGGGTPASINKEVCRLPFSLMSGNRNSLEKNIHIFSPKISPPHMGGFFYTQHCHSKNIRTLPIFSTS